jgi:tRNA (adenine37-N6)-methyltransferase
MFGARIVAMTFFDNRRAGVRIAKVLCKKEILPFVRRAQIGSFLISPSGTVRPVRNLVRRVLGRSPERFPDLPEITLLPIGVVRNSIKEPQPPGFDWQAVISRIMLRPELEDGLLGLDTYSHVKVMFWPHLVPPEVIGSKHRLHPRDDPQNPLQGILATRSQIRFNPILVTAVPLLSVKGNVLSVRGLDAVDGTPVLDIKPYFPHFDSIPDAKVPAWVTAVGEPGDGPRTTGGSTAPEVSKE